jgi:hypothetical protein
VLQWEHGGSDSQDVLPFFGPNAWLDTLE